MVRPASVVADREKKLDAKPILLHSNNKKVWANIVNPTATWWLYC